MDLRIGHGYDIHRLQPGGRLVLGGIEVATDISPIAHSDGDVVIHATVDAILGALGLGDIGEHFPDSDPRWRGAASGVFLESACAKAAAAGYAVVNLDVSILAQRPRLAPFREAMRRSLAKRMGIEEQRVNLKAGTNEGCDAVGRGEAIAAQAVVLLKK